MKLKYILLASVAAFAIPSATFAQDDDASTDRPDDFIITGSPLAQNASDTAATVTSVDRNKILE